MSKNGVRVSDLMKTAAKAQEKPGSWVTVGVYNPATDGTNAEFKAKRSIENMRYRWSRSISPWNQMKYRTTHSGNDILVQVQHDPAIPTRYKKPGRNLAKAAATKRRSAKPRKETPGILKAVEDLYNRQGRTLNELKAFRAILDSLIEEIEQ